MRYVRDFLESFGISVKIGGNIIIKGGRTMRKNQMIRLIVFIIAWLILIALPVFNDMYYLLLYYAVAVLILLAGMYWFIQDKKIEDRFYRKWHRLRERGFWINVIRAGIGSFIYMTVILTFGQLFGNGLTPAKLVSLLGGTIIWIMLVLFVFSFIIGVAAWYENEKRYHKIHINMKEIE